MKKYFFIALLMLQGVAFAQTNSWIDYNKTYYKFSIGTDGLCRISQSALSSMGLGNVPAEQFQLWHNGEEQILYTSVPMGVMGTSDYIEFFGKMNDGRPDTKLYRKPEYQLSDHYSMFTDTSAYFLTVNPAGGNLRYTNAANDVAGNTLSPETYFMNTKGEYFNSQMNPGYSIPVGGAYVYSSSFDIGEGWSTGSIHGGRRLTTGVGDLNLYTGGPNASLRYGAVGSAFNGRNVKVTFNTTVIDDVPMPYFNLVEKTISNIPVSLFPNNNWVRIYIDNTSSVTTDRMVVSYIELTYPSTWNFNNKTDFYFELPATTTGNFLEIENFNTGGAPPVLLDITSRKRYVGDIASSPGKIRFALPPSTIPFRKFRLVSQSAGAITPITAMTTRNFVNYGLASNQGDYIIISNPVLYTSSDGKNYVDLYKQYRSSAVGGGFNTIVVDINEITDQFAYGIKHHPSAVKSFVQFAATHFSVQPKYLFLIGKGVAYDEYAENHNSVFADQLNLVPTFGSPASDLLLASPGISIVPSIPVGRLSVTKGDEIGHYLTKVKEYIAQQNTIDNSLESKLWMKNVVQIVGGKDSSENTLFKKYMYGYGNIISDTLYGGHVEMFSKTSNAAVQLISTNRIAQLFAEGISIVSYFGHSSANTLEYNLSDPATYDNEGKYPFFLVSGCIAGNNYIFDSVRIMLGRKSISEDFVLSPQRGSIAFLASTHYGIPPYLDEYNTEFYNQLTNYSYGQPIGDIMKTVISHLDGDNPGLYYFSRADLEEMNLHGDPAIRVNSQPKPDYAIEDKLVSVDPVFISVSEAEFSLKVKFYNMGKAINDSIRVNIKRTYPGGSSELIFSKKMAAPHYSDSILLSVPIISTRDKGPNKIQITLDADNEVDEVSESNNTYTKEFFIYEEEARPIYPHNFAVINRLDQNLYASTANPVSVARQYVLQLDTTALFNSPLKIEKNVTYEGGILEFDPGITYQDSTVYYWRIAVVPVSGAPEDYHWNLSSFIYLENGTPGYMQSHYFQHLQSDTSHIRMDSSRKWKYSTKLNFIFANMGVYPSAATLGTETQVTVNGTPYGAGFCRLNGIVFTVINPETLKPWLNTTGTGLYGSNPVCSVRRLGNFEFYDLNTPASRKVVMDFMDTIPDNYYVAVRWIGTPDSASYLYADQMAADTAVFGPNNSLYHKLKEQGFALIDSFYRPRTFIFLYQKNNDQFVPDFELSDGIFDIISLQKYVYANDSTGVITSPKFGPARGWNAMHWRGYSLEDSSSDNPEVQIIGIDHVGNSTLLQTATKGQMDVDLSAIDAEQYPFLQLKMINTDSIAFSPYQLKYWQIDYDATPEGAIAPRLYFKSKDTLQQGEILHFGIAFKNISLVAFDSMKIKVSVLDRNNVTHPVAIPMAKPVVSGDSITLNFELDTRDYPGLNILFVEFNPDNDQPELYHFNNFIYHNFYVIPDNVDPLLDVTFDGIHILNRDIVSARPHIVIKLEDESEFLKLNDTSLLKVYVRFPEEVGGTLKRYYFNSDELRFTPASGTKNTATIDFTPEFQGEDESYYQLIVSGKDVLGNESGPKDYQITFRVIGKPMISNFLNYPNPFTTSTAFVFTITGYEIPQNIRIQILTVTGKVVREITKEELGPLHIGRNITEFKWDGTDMYGQPLANGVYLYRVLTNMGGKSMDAFDEANQKIIQGDGRKDREGGYDFFVKGYGKMYLMR